MRKLERTQVPFGSKRGTPNIFIYIYISRFYFPASGKAVVTGVVSSPARFLPSIITANKVQQSYCSSIFHRVLLTDAFALSASRIVHKKKFQQVYSSMLSAGLEHTKLTHTRLKGNLIRHRGDRYYMGYLESSIPSP